jgi:putative hydrolase
VSNTGPSGQGNFFERLLGDLVQMMGSAGTGAGQRLEMARMFAHNVAVGGPEANVDPSDRIRLEELARVAELHVSEASGLSVTPGGSAIEILAVGPGSWAWHTVEDWQFLLTAMIGASDPGAVAPGEVRPGAPGQKGGTGPTDRFSQAGLGLDSLDEQGLEADPFGSGDFGVPDEADLLNKVMATMGPMLAAMQLGSAVGHLARTTMGSYELPIPRADASRLLLVPANIARFANDWGLAVDEVRLWVCLRELTMHAVVTRPHVADRLRGLLEEFMSGAARDASGLAGLLGGMDPSDPESIQRLLMDDPEALLGVELSPERARVARELSATTAAMAGFVEYVLDQAGSRLLGDRTVLAEAWRRNQVEGRASMSSTEAFLGLDVGSVQVDRGSAFVNGVIERSGPEGLARLWESAATLPTPPEIDAPGLWLERLKLQDPSGA